MVHTHGSLAARWSALRRDSASRPTPDASASCRPTSVQGAHQQQPLPVARRPGPLHHAALRPDPARDHRRSHGPHLRPPPARALRLPLILAWPPITHPSRPLAPRPTGPRARWTYCRRSPPCSRATGPTRHGPSLFEAPVTAGSSAATHEERLLQDGFALRYRLRQGQAELLAVDGDAMPPADLSGSTRSGEPPHRELLPCTRPRPPHARESPVPIDPGGPRTPRAPLRWRAARYTRAACWRLPGGLLGSLLVAPARDGRRVSGNLVETEVLPGPRGPRLPPYGAGARAARDDVRAGWDRLHLFVYACTTVQRGDQRGPTCPTRLSGAARSRSGRGLIAAPARRGGALDLTSGPASLHRARIAPPGRRDLLGDGSGSRRAGAAPPPSGRPARRHRLRPRVGGSAVALLACAATRS